MEQFITTFFSNPSSVMLTVSWTVTLSKHPVEQLQVNSLPGGGAGVTKHRIVRFDPRTYSITSISLLVSFLGGSASILTANAMIHK